MDECESLATVGSIASIIGLIIGIIGTSFYYKITDKSTTKNNLKNTNINGKYVGRDENVRK